MKRKSGFSLIELLVVIGIMAMLAALTIPALINTLTSSADEQTYEMFAAQMNLARAIALTENAYTLVHCQPVQDSYVALHPELEDLCYMAILILDKTKGTDADGDGSLDGQFTLPRLHSNESLKSKYYSLDPVAFPKGWAIMAIDEWTVSTTNSGFRSTYLTDRWFHATMTATIIFNPSGQVVSQFPGGIIPMDTTSLLFGAGKTWTWSAGSNFYGKRPGATAVSIVNHGEVKYMMKDDGTTPDITARMNWLNENAQFLSINVYTGQLFPRTVPAPPTP